MATVTHRTELQLADEELLGLEDVRGARLHCVEGVIWLTLDRDPRDIVLNPGQSFVVDRGGVTLLHAMAPSRLRLDFTAEAARPTRAAGWQAAAAVLGRRLRAAASATGLAGA